MLASDYVDRHQKADFVPFAAFGLLLPQPARMTIHTMSRALFPLLNMGTDSVVSQCAVTDREGAGGRRSNASSFKRASEGAEGSGGTAYIA